MAKRTNNGTNRTEKQQISVILRSQLINDFKDIKCGERDYGRCMAQDLVSKNLYDHRGDVHIWKSYRFRFAFEFGRKHNVRVTYLNSDGIQSAVYNDIEWRMLMEDIKDTCDELYRNAEFERKRAEREAEEQRFNDAVRRAVKDLMNEQMKDCERTANALADNFEFEKRFASME